MTYDTSVTDSSIVSNQTYDNTDGRNTSDAGLFIADYKTGGTGSDTIEITGYTSNSNEDILVTVTSPSGNIVSIIQTSPESNGNFVQSLSTGGPLWDRDGVYLVTAKQGTDSLFADLVEVEIVEGLTVQ